MKQACRIALATLLLVTPLGVLSPALAEEHQSSQTATKDESQGTVQRGRRTRVRLGGISVGVGFSHFSGPRFYSYPYYHSGWYDPFWWGYPAYSFYSPFYHPGYFTGFQYESTKGEIRLRTEAKDASVLIDGAYAGIAGDLKSIWLDPGAYDLKVEAANRAPFTRRVYVLSGKTLRIEPSLAPQATEVRP